MKVSTKISKVIKHLENAKTEAAGLTHPNEWIHGLIEDLHGYVHRKFETAMEKEKNEI